MTTTKELMEFVRQFAFTEDEARPFVDRAQSRDYWLSLCPELTIGAPAPHLSRLASQDAVFHDVAAAIADYETCGHCIVHGAFPENAIEALRRAVWAVHAAGWPMIFAFVYDQFWALPRSACMDVLVGAIIGRPYQPAISFWVNHVPNQRGGSGFTPHTDDVRPGYPSVTCWIPLTAATPENGCVYVIERAGPGQGVPTKFSGIESFTAPQVASTLAHVRALPANPGAFLAWPNDTVHWGGRFLRGDEGRLAISWHFVGADYENVDADLERALIPDAPLPRFAHRLHWLCLSLLRFRGRDPVLERFAPV